MEPGSIAAIAVIGSLVPLIVLLIILILCLRKKYSINWYQASLIESHAHEQKEHLLRNGVDNSASSLSDVEHGSTGKTTLHSSAERVVSVSKTCFGSGLALKSAQQQPKKMGADESTLIKSPSLDLSRRQSAPSSSINTVKESEFKNPLAFTKSVPMVDPRRQNLAAAAAKLPTGTDITQPKRVNSRRRASMQDAIDVSKINAALYEADLRPQNPIREEASVDLKDPIGILHMTVCLHQDTSILKAHIHKADIGGFDTNISLRSPYFTLCISGCESKLLKTKPSEDPVHLHIDETFVFEVDEDLTGKQLVCSLYDHDPFIKTDEIGVVSIRLATIPINEPITVQKHIDRYQPEQNISIQDYAGQLLFSVCYQKSLERLNFVISKAKDLHIEDATHIRGLLVKIKVQTSSRVLKKKRTEVCKVSHTPSWNEPIHIPFMPDLLDNVSIHLELCKDGLSGHQVLGRVMLSKESEGKELKHWQDLLSSSSHTSTLEWWHYLSKVEKGNIQGSEN